MKTIVNVHEFKTHYSKYLEAARRGQTTVVGVRGNPVAELRPINNNDSSTRQPGRLKGKIWMSDDFDKPMTDLWNQIAKK